MSRFNRYDRHDAERYRGEAQVARLEADRLRKERDEYRSKHDKARDTIRALEKDNDELTVKHENKTESVRTLERERRSWKSQKSDFEKADEASKLGVSQSKRFEAR